LVVKKILMAIDRSGYKEKIINFTISLAKPLGAQIIAIHVMDRSTIVPATDAYGNYIGGDQIQDTEDELRKQADKILGEAELLGDKEKVKVDKAIIVASSSSSSSSSCAAAIIDYAKRNNVDLIVIGTKGMTGLKHFLLGSVANSIISHAHCPVLAVR
jgi:nucleotide-binding universal stress UspA family protein